MRVLLFVLALTFGASCANAQNVWQRPETFVDAAAIIPTLQVDMRYAGTRNFVGRRITGYQASVCLLTREAATALGHAQTALAPFGLGLKVFDCYRPARAVAHFARWARDLQDQAHRAEYYPNVDKSQLLALGYIAERSGHSRGSTLDVTIVDLASGSELDMGSAYDLFDPLSWPSDPRPNATQRAHRMLLQNTMRAAGFRPLREEWWHFTLEREPFPDTYFDFVVR